MPAITREDIAPNQIALQVTLTPEDYQEAYEKELSEYRKNATLKGFRKGKTPASVVRNLFGKQVLAKILDEQLQQAIAHYLREENLALLGNLIPTEDAERTELDVRQMQDYPFRFEGALMPNVDVKGIAPTDTYEQYIVTITEEMVDKEWQKLRSYARKEVQLEEGHPPTPEDSVRFEVAATNGAPLSKTSEGHSFSCPVADIQDENFRQQVLNASIGAKFQVDNIYTLFPGEPREVYVERMQWPESMLEELPAAFQFTIKGFFRESYEIDQNFLNHHFGPDEVSSEAEARERIRQSIKTYWEQRSNELLWEAMSQRIIEQTSVDYPDEFIRKQIRYRAETELSEQEVEEALDAVKSKSKWNIILDTLAKHHNLKVSEQDLLQHFFMLYKRFFGQYRYFSDEQYLDMAYEALKDEKRVAEATSRILANKLSPLLFQQVTLVTRHVTPEELEDIAYQLHSKASTPIADTDDEENTEPAALE